LALFLKARVICAVKALLQQIILHPSNNMVGELAEHLENHLEVLHEK